MNEDENPKDKQPSQPTDFIHLLPWLSPAVASMAGKGAESLLKYVQSPDAVLVQVLDSKQVQDKHQVQFKVTNNTLHGVYLESAVLAEPGGNSTVTQDQKVDSFSFSGSPETDRPRLNPFPKLLHSGDVMLFNVEFPLGDKERKMKWDSAGKLELKISRLDQSNSEKKEVTFMIRWN